MSGVRERSSLLDLLPEDEREGVLGLMSMVEGVGEALVAVFGESSDLEVLRDDLEVLRDGLVALAVRQHALCLCAYCGFDVLEGDERFMVHDEVWALTGKATDGGQLCVFCVEWSIGRRLVPADFPSCPMNFPEGTPYAEIFPQSARLRDRMGKA